MCGRRVLVSEEVGREGLHFRVDVVASVIMRLLLTYFHLHWVSSALGFIVHFVPVAKASPTNLSRCKSLIC